MHAEGNVDEVVGADGASSGWGSSAYRPYLDGLRAVAVYLVLLFHAGSDRFTGGYVGVDVFFVLSGFLVTQLLLRDLTALGAVQFRRFYSRRFRRLLPAAFVTLIVTAFVFTALASPVDVANAVGGFKAAFLYVTNWYFIHQATNYFGTDVTTNPVLHFWSLAVEEQFYLLWPLLLGGLFLATRRLRDRQWPVVRIAVAVAALASLALAWSLRISEPSHAYYGTDTRAYQLLAGALLALTPTLIRRAAVYHRAARWIAVAATATLVFLASAWIHLDPIQRGTAVTITTAILLIALETASGGPVQRALSIEPMVYLGKISYGTYLWHWPVILVLTTSFHTATLSTIILTALVATGLASLSYQLLERPIRVSALLDRHRLPVIAAGLTVSVISAVILIPAITDPGATTTAEAAADTTGFTPVPAGLKLFDAFRDGSDWGDCLGKPASACTLVHGTGTSIFLMGDSHAGMLEGAFKSIAEKNNLTFSDDIHGGCPWQRNLYITPVMVFGKELRTEDCQKIKDDAYTRVIPALKPDVIVVINLGYEDAAEGVPFLGPDGNPIVTTTPEGAQWFQKTTRDSIAELEAGGAKVVMIEPIPLAPRDMNPLSCLSKATVLEQCRYVAKTGPDDVERFYRSVDKADDHVWSADFDELVCPYLPICDPLLHGQIVKFDGSHITLRYAIAIAPAIDAYLKDNGIR